MTFSQSSCRCASALVAASAAVLAVTDELLNDLGPLELRDAPPTEYAADGFTVLVALEIDCLTSFSASSRHFIDASSARRRSNLVLHANGRALTFCEFLCRRPYWMDQSA